MMEATLNLVSREALELHYQGVTYGPIAHTQALGVLLFALQPSSVRCATQPGAFEAAMQQVLAAARKTTDLLTTWAEEASSAKEVRRSAARISSALAGCGLPHGPAAAVRGRAAGHATRAPGQRRRAG